MAETQSKPVPVADDLTRPFWDAARQGRLVVQQCGSCGYYNHPPRPACENCLSQELSFVPVSGRGTIYTFSVMHLPGVPGFQHETPFLTIVVELVEQRGLLMVSNLAGSLRPQVRIGAPVEVWFERREAEVVVPQFRFRGSAHVAG